MTESWCSGSLGYSEVLETLTLCPGAACHRVWVWHAEWTGQCPISRNLWHWGHAHLRAVRLGCSAPGVSISLAPEESTVWSQADRFAPSASCTPWFWVLYSVTSLSLPLDFRGPPASLKYWFPVVKSISLNYGTAFWVNNWISERCFPAAVMLWDCSLCSLASLAAELNSCLSEADMVCYFLFHLIVCLG